MGGRTSHRTLGAPVEKIIAGLEHTHPDAKLALDFTSPLELLVALILAAQCTDVRVNEVTATLFKRLRAARDYAEVPQAELEELVRSTGFFRQKAKAIRACCQQLMDRFGGQVPHDRDALLSLPGVGRKTANILLGNAFGVPAIGVDTHVGRLSQRLGLTTKTDPDEIEADLTAVVPIAKQIRFCHLLQYHGRRVCFARCPNCPDCVLLSICPFPDKTPPAPRKAAPERSRWLGKSATARVRARKDT
jgi:endonuclease-3